MARLKLMFSRLSEILWRLFGLVITYLIVGIVLGGVGAGISGDVMFMFIALAASFVPALIEAYSEIGEEIARDARITKAGINKAFNKAADNIDRQEKKAEEKSAK